MEKKRILDSIKNWKDSADKETYLFEVYADKDEGPSIIEVFDIMNDVDAKLADTIEKGEDSFLVRFRCTKDDMKYIARCLKLPYDNIEEFIVDTTQFKDGSITTHDALGNRLNAYEYYCNKYGKDVVDKVSEEKGISWDAFKD